MAEEDLTKLSGLELATQIRAAWAVNEGTPPLTEAVRRLEEDDRVAMRNIERERDGLRAQCESWKRKALATQAVIDRDDSIAQGMSTAELVAEVKRQRETRVTAVEALTATKANMERMERDLLLRLGDAETLADSRLSIVTRLQDSLNETRGELFELRKHANALEDKNGCLSGEIKQLMDTCANQRKELHALNKERKATLTKLEDTQRRVAELEEQRELDAGSLRSAINNAQSRLAQVKRMETDCDRLRALAEVSARVNTAQEERVYGETPWNTYTIDQAISEWDKRSATHQMAATLKAVETLVAWIEEHADRMPTERAIASGMKQTAIRVREVLNGKR